MDIVWDVEGTNEFAVWWESLTVAEQRTVGAAVEALEEHGPGLGRPLVDSIQGSRHHNMKELRPRGGNIRILLIFDPRRTAILLLGGDKTSRWHEWYAEMLPVADDLYDVYLDELRKEGLL